MVETALVGVCASARTAIAMKAMASGQPVAELASRVSVLDPEDAELHERLAQWRRDRAREARDRARTEAVLSTLGWTDERA